jgi:hypothetical protein
MRVDQVRKLLEKYSEKDLHAIVIALYKAVPKRAREDHQIDILLQDPDAWNRARNPAKQTGSLPDPEDLRYEIEQFISDARNQYYFAPNSVIHKSQRSKWRFMVKSYYKDLVLAASVAERVPGAAELLQDLYILLCKACGEILFGGYDPFQSVGISQSDFFHRVLSLSFQYQPKPLFMSQAISLIVENHLNRYTLYSSLIQIFGSFLTLPDLKTMAVAECQTRIQKLRNEKLPEDRDTWHASSAEYAKREKLKTLVEIAFSGYISLFEYDNAIRLFHEHYWKLEHREVALYVLLQWLARHQLSDLWLNEYERAVRSRIRPRQELTDAYESLKQNGIFPR